jgi:integrase
VRADLWRTPTVAQWLDSWLASIEMGLKPSSATFYRNMIDLYLAPALGHARIDVLAGTDIAAAYRAMLARGLSPATVNAAHRTLRTAMNTAVAQGLVARSPVAHVRPPRDQPAEIVPLDIDEIQRVLATALTRRNSARWAVALALGLRQSVALGLLWDRDVDMDAATLTVRRPLQRRNWKHGCEDSAPCGLAARQCPQRWRTPLTDTPKTGAGERTVGLPPQLVRILREHRRAQAEERLRGGNLWRDEGWVFTSEIGTNID